MKRPFIPTHARRWLADGALVAAVSIGTGTAMSSCNLATPPSTIAADCSTDVTTQLNSFFAGLASGTTVYFPTSACYLVSNSPGSLLTLNGTNGVTIYGNSATLEQKTYNGGSCASNVNQPILWLQANVNLTISDLTIEGPGGCGGPRTEGGYGIFMGKNPTGNSGVTMTGVQVEDTTGDGLAILPLLGSGTGINTDVAFTDGSFSNIGYHVLTLEGINGLNFTGNVVSGFGNFADLEVDTNCGYVNGANECLSGPDGTPTSTAQWNVTIDNNAFTNATGQVPWIESEQGTCVPQENLDIKGNLLDATVNADIVLRGSYAPCPTDSGLTIKGNVSFAASKSPCGGSVTQPPACAVWEVEDYGAVTITGNTLAATDGQPHYFPNTPWVACIAVAAVYGSVVTDNTCNNAWAAVDPAAEQFSPLPEPNVGLVECKNTYWLTEPVNGAAPEPRTDGICTHLGRRALNQSTHTSGTRVGPEVVRRR